MNSHKQEHELISTRHLDVLRQYLLHLRSRSPTQSTRPRICDVRAAIEAVLEAQPAQPAPVVGESGTYDIPGAWMAMHWIDRYAAGIDEVCQLDCVADALLAARPGGEGEAPNMFWDAENNERAYDSIEEIIEQHFDWHGKREFTLTVQQAIRLQDLKVAAKVTARADTDDEDISWEPAHPAQAGGGRE